jgi:hypothetical protein
VSIVQAQAIMSLDGYVAKPDNTIGRLFDWPSAVDLALRRQLILSDSPHSAHCCLAWLGATDTAKLAIATDQRIAGRVSSDTSEVIAERVATG